MRLGTFGLTAALLAGFAISAKADIVTNGNFSPANPGVGYGPVAGWTETGTGGAGSNAAGQPFWDNGVVPGGVTTAGFLQGNEAFSQMLTGLTPGASYTLTFFDNARICGPNCNATPTLSVSVDGTSFGSMAVTPVGGSNPFNMVMDSFVASSGSELLTFSSNTGNADGTLLLSGVSVNAVAATPEPSSLMLLGTGILGAAGMMRRRFMGR